MEPYKLFFGAGGLFALISLAAWFLYFFSLGFSASPWSPVVYPGLLHLFSMLFGVMGFYVAGFLLTAFPKWIGSAPPTPREYLFLFALQAFAQLAGLFGAFVSAGLFKLGFWVQGIFQIALLLLLFQKYRKSGIPDKIQPRFVLVSLLAAGLSWAMALAYLYFPSNFLLFAFSVQLASLPYLLLLILSVTSRIIPFFSSKVLPNFTAKPHRSFLPQSMALMALICLFQGLPWSGKTFLLVPLKLALGFLLFKQWISWKPFASVKQPLLLVLHISWAWIFVYLILGLISDLFFPLQFKIQFAFSHAFFIGCAMSLLLGISTRVVRGHGGYPLLLDRPAALAFALLQLAALTRIALPLFGLKWEAFNHLTPYASLLAIAAFAIWMLAYAPLLLRNAPSKT